MKNLLLKMNMIKDHNHIRRLEYEKEQCNAKIKELTDNANIFFGEYKELINKISNEKQLLEQKNKILEREKDFYKNTLESMPKFLIRLFTKKRKLLNKGE